MSENTLSRSQVKRLQKEHLTRRDESMFTQCLLVVSQYLIKVLMLFIVVSFGVMAYTIAFEEIEPDDFDNLGDI